MVRIIFPDVDLNGIKGIFIDLDNTLYDYDSCHEIALDACFNAMRIDPDFSIEQTENFKTSYRYYRDIITARLIPQGSCRSRLLAFMEMFEAFDIPAPYIKSSFYDHLYWSTLIAHMKLEPSFLEFLKKVKDLNLKTVIVSDMTTAIQIQKIEALDITKFIDYIVTSEGAGFEKPHHAIYQLALNKVNLLAHEVIMIGDSEEKDIKGALNMGIKAYKVARVS